MNERETDMSAEQETEQLYAGRHLSVRARSNWEFVTRNTQKPAVGIVAITNDDRVVLVEQYRLPVGKNVIELPAGLSGDIVGSEAESLLEAAKRELLEETGYEAARWTELTEGYSSPGLTDESIVLFLAEGLTKRTLGGGDPTEAINIHEVPLQGVMAWLADRGAQADLKLLAGLFATQEYRKQQGNSHGK